MTLLFCLLLLPTFGMWAFVSENLFAPGTSDAAGDGLVSAFSMFYVAAVWLLLAVLLLIAGARGEMPAWTALTAVVVHPLSCGVAVAAVDLLMKERAHAPPRWLAAAPLLAPPLIAAYAAWVFFPFLRAAVPSGAAGTGVWGVVLAASLVSWRGLAGFAPVLQARRDRESVQRGLEAKKREDAETRERLAAFERLPPDTPLWELKEYTGREKTTDRLNPLDGKAWEAMARSERRQADAEAMLRRGDGFPLREHERLDLRASPELCESARGYLLGRAKAEANPSSSAQGYAIAAESFPAYFPPIEWLVRGGCRLEPVLDAAEASIRTYEDNDLRRRTLAELARLRGIPAAPRDG
jgi:hypothetical protein